MLLAALVLLSCVRTDAHDCGAAPTITIDVYQAEIGNVVRVLGEVGGVNIVFGDEVKGKVSIKLRQVPWDQALDVILKSKDLGMRRHGNVIRVAPQSKLDAEQQARLDAQHVHQSRAPLVTRVIPVNHARASEMAVLIKPWLSTRGSLTVDERTNSLIVTDVQGSRALNNP
jgi:type IV pilus assembly protein PilQ